jgi:hypothetical protein
VFSRPKTSVEWALAIGVIAATVLWGVLRCTWATPASFVHSFTLNTDDPQWGRVVSFLPADLLFMVPLWLLYGFLREKVRKRQSSMG